VDLENPQRCVNLVRKGAYGDVGEIT